LAVWIGAGFHSKQRCCCQGHYFDGGKQVVDGQRFVDNVRLSDLTGSVDNALFDACVLHDKALIVAAGRGERLGTAVPKAFVTLAPGFTASDDLARELQNHVKSVTAPYKYPREIEFVDDLPKTVSGKIRRVELRERGRARAAGAREVLLKPLVRRDIAEALGRALRPAGA